MSFREQARAAARGGPCSMCRCLSLLDDDLRDEVVEALDDPACSDRSILAELARRDVPELPAYQQIGHHRRRTCGGKAG